MKYVPSVLVQTMSGSQGDSTFSTGAGGDYIRRRVNPAQPRTEAQQEVRATFSAASAAWRSLTQAQRNGWTALAATVTRTDRYGKTYRPTGQQLFVASRTLASFSSQGAISDAPATSAQGNVITFIELIAKRGATAADDVITVDGNVQASGQPVVIFATAPFSAGRAYVSPGQYKKLGVFSQGDLNAGVSIKSLYEALFGRPTLGSHIALKAYCVSSGMFAGPEANTTAIVVAV